MPAAALHSEVFTFPQRPGVLARASGCYPATVLAAILVPVFIAALGQYTIEALDRYYARFLEAAIVR